MIFENKRVLKIVSLILCCTVIGSGTAAIAYATGVKQTEEKITQETAAAVSAKQETTEGISKDETVYVIAGADGSAKRIIVSDWIKNTLGSASIPDITEMEDVTNVKGDETYSMNGDHMRVWDANGNDIYYQGDIEKELPVTMAIRFQLDGRQISAEELAGKSGRVTIRFEYTNTQYDMVEIDGQQEKIYVPFVVLTGMILDNENFRNIQVSNGKLINDGDRTIVAGIAMPGLADNLKLDSDVLDLPEAVEIEADVTDFQLTTTVTLATNELFNKLEWDGAGELDQVSDSLEELKDAMEQLVDGSSALYDGIAALLDKSGELIDGIDQLAAGAKQLSEGAGTVDGGVAQLQAGAAQLTDGLGALTANNEALNGGAKEVFESMLSMADSQLAAAGLAVDKLTIENYATVLQGILATLDETAVYNLAYNTAHSKVESAVRAQESNIQAQVTAAVQAQVLEGVLGSLNPPMTPSQYEAAVDAGQIPAEIQGQIGEAVEGQMKAESIQTKIQQTVEAQIQTLIQQNMQSSDVTAQIQAAVESGKSGAFSISALKTQLDRYNQFYQGLLTYTAGVADASGGADAIKAGTDALKDGTASLKSGADALSEGLHSLQDGSGALADGVQQLRDGAMQLSDGLKEFNEQGIQKLYEAVNEDLDSLLTRFRATCDVSREYKSFAGIRDEMEGQVKFIYRTEEISK